MKKSIAFALALVVGEGGASAQSVGSLAPGQVMTGNASAFSDGVWLRVSGQVGHANCFYAPGNSSLFYAKPNGAVDPKKALAILMTAKLSGRTVDLQYDSNGVQTDFYGYGISQCEIVRLVLN